MTQNLERFIDAQRTDYAIALSEIKNGRKQSHWMWYIFPQIQGLGYRSISKRYAIQHLREAEAYLQHPELGRRLVEISQVLLGLASNDAHRIFGTPDDLKLKSSMTLFAAVPGADPVFEQVLQKFFKGVKDDHTLRIIE